MRRQMVQEWRDLYAGVLPEKPKALKWSSNINIPLMQYQVLDSAVQMTRTALGAEPMFEVEALDPEYDQFSGEEENYLQFWNDRVRLRSKGHMAILDACITGTAWLWPGVESTGMELPAWDEQSLGQPLRIDQLDAVPRLDYVVFEDMMLLPFNAPSFERARGAFARKWMRWSEILKAKKAGKFESEAVDRIEQQWQQARPATQTEEQQGVDSETPLNIWGAQFECWQGVYRYAKPGTDDEQEWFCTLYWSSESGGDAVVLQAVPYEPLFGKRWCFVPLVCDPKPNSMWGGSLCQSLGDLQRWVNATFNQASDALTINILPPMAVGAGAQARNLVWGPLEKWPVSPAEVQVLQGNPQAFAGVSASLGMIDFTRQMAERISGVNDMTAGKPNQEKRTAFEINAVIEAGNQIFEHKVALLQIGMDEGQGLEAYAELMMEIFRKFLPKRPVQYRSRKSAADPWTTVDPQWHEGSYQFIARGNSANSNPEVRSRRAVATRQASQASPFCMISPLDTPEIVLDKVQRLYRVESDFMQALGQKHPETYVGGEPQSIDEAMAIAMVINPQVVAAIHQRITNEQQANSGLAPGPMVPPEGPAPEGAPGGAAGAFGGGEGLPGAFGEAGMVPAGAGM
jgi:hypothetical protein